MTSDRLTAPQGPSGDPGPASEEGLRPSAGGMGFPRASPALGAVGGGGVTDHGRDPAESWLAAGWISLDGEGRVELPSESLLQWLRSSPEQVRGKRLQDLLEGVESGWGRRFEHAWLAKDRFGECVLPGRFPEGPHWLRVELARVGSQTFARLSSTLPSSGELQQVGLKAFAGTSSPATVLPRLVLAESQLEHLWRRWPGVVFNQRADFSFQFASPRIEVFTGVPPVEWARKPLLFWQVVHEADVENLQSAVGQMTREHPHLTMTYRIRHLRTGRVCYVLDQREATFTEAGLLVGYEGFWVDVSRQVIAERRLASAAWKETVALLTAGLAHDLGNVIAGIHALSETFLAQLAADHPFQEGLTLIRRNSLQASQLVQRMVRLQRTEHGERNYQDLNAVLQDTVDLIRRAIPRRIQVDVQLLPQQVPVYVDELELRQVIINLGLNAADAMPNNGSLAFEITQHGTLPEKEHVQGVLPRPPCLSLAVKDTGCGIPVSRLTSIFDPFYTTKSANRGSGLGLYNARLFAERHQGAITVDSGEDRGSTFCIWLPLADFTETERQRIGPAAPRHAVLVVGSPAHGLEQSANLLRERGYYVLAAPAVEAAREALTDPGYQFSALLLQLDEAGAPDAQLLRMAQLCKPPLKTILQVVGCNRDDLDTNTLAQFDLVLDQDTPFAGFLERMGALLDQGTR